MFKVNIKEVYRCPYCKLLTYFKTCASVFMVNFELVIAGWAMTGGVIF